ncbi:uncharacterized protein [Rutidosis leptorrhynchoides]|uniref:uncharacterized protein n=1 Tax=Rutidosis leptorrhynchoides TaxID=125765 RepID=UPI003A9A48EE
MSESNGLESPTLRSSRKQPLTPHPDPSKCPRCESTNTKFCYYNNYNKFQPRYFCKACKRHWTNGGTLRNVPIGGGRNKNKRLRQSNIISNPTTLAIRNKTSSDQNSPSDPKERNDASNETLFNRDDVESYMDIEELKGISELSSSCESDRSLNDSTSFIEMNGKNEDSSIATSMIMPSFQETSSFLELNNWNWKDLDILSLEDMNKPWEDPTFKT